MHTLNVGRKYRNRPAAVLPAVAGLAAFAVLLGAGWALAAGPGSQVVHVVEVSLCVIAGLLLLFFGLGTALSCVRVLRSGIRVVNPASVREIAWEEIASFTLGRWGPFPHVCLIQLRDGSHRAAWGISGGDAEEAAVRGGVAHPVAELNALLASVLAGQDQGPAPGGQAQGQGQGGQAQGQGQGGQAQGQNHGAATA